MSRKRKGMLIKNTNRASVQIKMSSRTIFLGPGDEELLSAEEVLDNDLRAKLQIRAVSIVRPATDEEEGIVDTGDDVEADGLENGGLENGAINNDAINNDDDKNERKSDSD